MIPNGLPMTTGFLLKRSVMREMWSNLATALNQKTGPLHSFLWLAKYSRRAAVFVFKHCTKAFSFYVNTNRSFNYRSFIISLQKAVQFHVTADVFSIYFLLKNKSLKTNKQQKTVRQCFVLEWRKANCNVSKHGWTEGMFKGLLRKNLHPHFLHCCDVMAKDFGMQLDISIPSKTGHYECSNKLFKEPRGQTLLGFFMAYQTQTLIYYREKQQRSFISLEKHLQLSSFEAAFISLDFCILSKNKCVPRNTLQPNDQLKGVLDISSQHEVPRHAKLLWGSNPGCILNMFISLHACYAGSFH